MKGFFIVKKQIRIMAFISTAMMALSLILLIISFPFQEEIASWIHGGSVIERFSPYFPLMQFLNCLSRTVLVALLIIFSGNKKRGMKFEILILVALIIVLPIINYFVQNNYYHPQLVNGEIDKLVSYNLVSQISSYLLLPSLLGSALAYVTCGMSIAFKSMNKEQDTEQ